MDGPSVGGISDRYAEAPPRQGGVLRFQCFQGVTRQRQKQTLKGTGFSAKKAENCLSLQVEKPMKTCPSNALTI
jgi:hypothetical protein